MGYEPNRREIIFILPTLGGGGAERVVLTLMNSLDRLKWRICLLIVGKNIGELEAELSPDVTVLRLGAPRARSAALGILRQIWRRRPAVVFSTLDHMNGLIGLLKPFFPPRTKLVLRATDFKSVEGGGLRYSLALAFRLGDLLIYQSKAMELHFRDKLRLPKAHRGITISNPLNINYVVESSRVHKNDSHWEEFLSGRDGTLTMVAAGRLAPAKGFDILIDAIEKLGNEKLRLFILGEGPSRRHLEEKISTSGLNSQVRLCGFQSNPYAWFSHADLFVLSSVHEGFPNVVLEALATGCPVIATPMPGLEDLAGVSLFTQISVDALADGIAGAFLERPAISVATEIWLKRHDAPNIAAAYNEALLDLTRGI